MWEPAFALQISFGRVSSQKSFAMHSKYNVPYTFPIDICSPSGRMGFQLVSYYFRVQHNTMNQSKGASHSQFQLAPLEVGLAHTPMLV